MCTLSWLRAPAAGYQAWFNRDERRERAPEEPPRELVSGGVRVLSPADGAVGGTWITANEFGLTLALLNGYTARRGPAPREPRSRGLLVRDLSDAAACALVDARLAAADLARYEPFVLACLAPDEEARAWRWDGLELARETGDAALCPLASSGFSQAAAQRARHALWRAQVGPRGTAADHERFLAAHGEDRRISPCMHREDACTRSQVHVRVDATRVLLEHRPGAPCEAGGTPTRLTLARRRTQA